jgi:hypothetical protein
MTNHLAPPAGGAMPPLCVKCETRMAYECETRIAYVTTIPRVTEPGTVALFQCEHCEMIDIRSIEGRVLDEGRQLGNRTSRLLPPNIGRSPPHQVRVAAFASPLCPPTARPRARLNLSNQKIRNLSRSRQRKKNRELMRARRAASKPPEI